MLISSSTNRVGSAQTPWHNIFDVDNGHIRYFGDAKTPGQDPAQTPENKVFLEAHAIHSAVDPSKRARATMVLKMPKHALVLVFGRRQGQDQNVTKGLQRVPSSHVAAEFASSPGANPGS